MKHWQWHDCNAAVTKIVLTWGLSHNENIPSWLEESSQDVATVWKKSSSTAQQYHETHGLRRSQTWTFSSDCSSWAIAVEVLGNHHNHHPETLLLDIARPVASNKQPVIYLCPPRFGLVQQCSADDSDLDGSYHQASVHNQWDDPTKLNSIVLHLVNTANLWTEKHSADISNHWDTDELHRRRHRPLQTCQC